MGTGKLNLIEHEHYSVVTGTRNCDIVRSEVLCRYRFIVVVLVVTSCVGCMIVDHV